MNMARFTMSALPGTPSIQNAIPMLFFGTTTFAAPGIGLIAAAIMLGFGLWWLSLAEAAARRKGEAFGSGALTAPRELADDQPLRERASLASAFDTAELPHGRRSGTEPPILLAALPLAIVMGVNFLMSIVVLPLLDTSYLAEEHFRATSLSAVGGVWAVVVALAAATLTLVLPSGSGSLRCARAWTRAPMRPCFRL